jgi:hypothetical protein
MAHLPLSPSRGRPWLLGLLVGAFLLSSCSASSTSQRSQQTGPNGGGQLTPLLNSTLSAPRWFGGTDGKAHLVYELLLTNAIPVPVTLSALEVRDADSGATLIRLAGDSLRAATSPATSPDTAAVLLPPASVGIVWLDIPPR